MAYLSYDPGNRARHNSYYRINRINEGYMKENPKTINYQAILLEKKFARKQRSNIIYLVLIGLIFFSLLAIKKSYANEVSQATTISLHTAAGAVSFSNRLDNGKDLWVK